MRRPEHREFVQHTFMGSREELSQYGVAFSQPHALVAADLDGDGLTDVVVGKRRWAHGPKGDIEPGAPGRRLLVPPAAQRPRFASNRS